MVRNLETGGGKKHKRKKNTTFTINRQLEFKEDGQEYGIIEALLGSKRCTVKLVDGTKVLGIIRGNMKKGSSRVNKDDIVLVSLREFQDSKVDIIHVYLLHEVKSLIAYEELDAKFVFNDTTDTLYENVIFEDIDDI